MKQQLSIDEFHTYLNTVLTELLENQIRTRSFMTGVQQYKNQIIENSSVDRNDDSQLDWEALLKSNKQLIKLGTLSWERSIDQIKKLLVKCDDLVRELHKVMIDRELYEHQSRVLQGIILSHDKIENWEEFVQSILRQFHSIFEFNFFSIAFNNSNGIDLYLYYMGEFPAQAKIEAKNKLSEHMTSKLSSTKVLRIKEYQVFDKKLEGIDISQMHSVTIDVEGEQENLGGLLEMGYFSSIPLGIDEESIIRSILSVMVMVIGSSRTLKKTLRELDFHAKQDPLTGLYNRRYFNGFLEKEIERSRRYEHEFCILMLDLDNFKGINDTYGHSYGDNVLRAIAQILKDSIRSGDLIARLGGDEFIITLPETDMTGAQYVAREIKKAIKVHQFSDEHNFNITTSIGLVSYPNHSSVMADLLSDVDIALYQAKADGRDIVCTYNPKMSARSTSKKLFEVTQDLSHAIKDDRIIAYFQPIVSTADRSVFAYKALARLVDEKGEIVSAEQIIEMAGESNIRTDIDKCMINNVINALLRNYNKVDGYPLVFLDLSPISVQKRGILQYAASVCQEQGISPDRFVFEISEREVISDRQGMKQFLGELRKYGFAFCLGNFGSGCNSFRYLRDLYFEYVKIDGEFVKNMQDSKADNALIEALYSLSEKLGMKAIAEFVENDDILMRLQEVGIPYCQGFHTGMPSSKIG